MITLKKAARCGLPGHSWQILLFIRYVAIWSAPLEASRTLTS
jgi:hypothetical protein